MQERTSPSPTYVHCNNYVTAPFRERVQTVNEGVHTALLHLLIAACCLVNRRPTQASPSPNKMAARGDDMKRSKVLCRALAKIFGLVKRGKKRHRSKKENTQLAVQFFTGRSDPDDETLSSSTISPSNAEQLRHQMDANFLDCFPSLHGKDEISIAALRTADEHAPLNEQSQRSRDRRWTESTVLSKASVSHKMTLLVWWRFNDLANNRTLTHFNVFHFTSRNTHHHDRHPPTIRGQVAT